MIVSVFIIIASVVVGCLSLGFATAAGNFDEKGDIESKGTFSVMAIACQIVALGLMAIL